MHGRGGQDLVALLLRFQPVEIQGGLRVEISVLLTGTTSQLPQISMVNQPFYRTGQFIIADTDVHRKITGTAGAPRPSASKASLAG